MKIAKGEKFSALSLILQTTFNLDIIFSLLINERIKDQQKQVNLATTAQIVIGIAMIQIKCDCIQSVYS